MYAIIGIPLMLLFLTNIGDVLAKVWHKSHANIDFIFFQIFRFLYAQSIRLKFRIILWHKKRKVKEKESKDKKSMKLSGSKDSKSQLASVTIDKRTSCKDWFKCRLIRT